MADYWIKPFAVTNGYNEAEIMLYVRIEFLFVFATVVIGLP